MSTGGENSDKTGLYHVANLKGGVWDKKLESSRRVYGEEGLSPTVTTCLGGGTEPKIMIKNNTKKGYVEATNGDSINLAYPESETRRGRVGNQVAQTIQCNDQMGVINNLRIRKLTPKECWRLMGFDDEDFEKAKKSLNETFYKGKDKSTSQLYKQARKFNRCKRS